MDYCNNHFIRTTETIYATITGATITTNVSGKYLVGQHIMITRSVLNDGVYKITDITGNVITVDATLVDEVNTVILDGLAVPEDFITLTAEIEAGTFNDGVSSESLGDYSVAYKDGSGWQDIYRGKLTQYKKPFSDLLRGYYDPGR